MYKGIFWWIGEKPITVKVECNADGIPLMPADFSAKSGQNFNHKAEWEKLPRRVTDHLSFDHYPRGRVEIRKGKITIWLHPSLNNDAVLARLKAEFALEQNLPLRVVSDGSRHYRINC